MKSCREVSQSPPKLSTFHDIFLFISWTKTPNPRCVHPLGLLCSTDIAVTPVSRDMLESILNELAWVTLLNWDSTSSRNNTIAQTTEDLHRSLGRICSSCKTHAKPCVAVNALPVASSCFSWASVGAAGSPPPDSALAPGHSSIACLFCALHRSAMQTVML